MASQPTAAIGRAGLPMRGLAAVRLLLPLGWGLAAAGYLGPWIGHRSAALTLSGVDMGEFVKFLPTVLDGSLHIIRQLFYLPALAVAVSVAWLVGSRRLHYPWTVKAGALALAVLMSVQLLPPAWSPATLRTPEFRLQALAMGLCWLLLAGFWLWPRLPGWLMGGLSAAVSLAGLGLSGWQLWLVKPAIDQVYGRPPTVGWGCLMCMAGLVIVAAASVVLAVPSRTGFPACPTESLL
jgi:hypothetical protein